MYTLRSSWIGVPCPEVPEEPRVTRNSTPILELRKLYADYNSRPLLTSPFYAAPLFLMIMLMGMVAASSCVASNEAALSLEQQQKIKQAFDYARQQAPTWVPGLAPVMQDPTGWVGSHLGLSLGFLQDRKADDAGIGDDLDDFFSPVADMMQPMRALMEKPEAETPNAFWLSPQYHHKGLLPTKDAFVAGVNLRQSVFGNALQAEFHPFYGQGWRGGTGYWGTEMTLNLGALHATPAKNPAATNAAPAGMMPKGSLTLRYTGGTRDLMDRGHGIELRSSLNFTERLSLNAGVQQDQNAQRSDYVLVQWKMPLE